jgi:hypothetical protein
MWSDVRVRQRPAFGQAIGTHVDQLQGRNGVAGLLQVVDRAARTPLAVCHQEGQRDVHVAVGRIRTQVLVVA